MTRTQPQTQENQKGLLNSGVQDKTVQNDARWYCVRTRVKTENLAAMRLRADLRVEVFSPSLRFQRLRRSMPVWTTEALFPGYLFAKFSHGLLARAVQASHGVTGIVEFGNLPASVPCAVIESLQKHFQDGEVVVIGGDLSPGTEVTIADGPFRGLNTVVTQVNSPRQRVAVLIEVLGQAREIEMAHYSLKVPGSFRLRARELLAV